MNEQDAFDKRQAAEWLAFDEKYEAEQNALDKGQEDEWQVLNERQAAERLALIKKHVALIP